MPSASSEPKGCVAFDPSKLVYTSGVSGGVYVSLGGPAGPGLCHITWLPSAVTSHGAVQLQYGEPWHGPGPARPSGTPLLSCPVITSSRCRYAPPSLLL